MDKQANDNVQVVGVVPYLTVPDAKAASEFYQRAFAGQEVDRRPSDSGKLMHCQLVINGGTLMFCDAFPEWGHDYKPAQGFMLHLQVKDPQAWWDRAVEAGATVSMPLKKEFWGDLYGQLRDPFGVSWTIGGPAPQD
jgi:PhnB protein